MNKQMISNEEMRISSREVAGMLRVTRHAGLLAKIVGINKFLENNDIEFKDYWIESTYKDSTGRTLREYLITKKGCELLAHKMTGEKGALFSNEYIQKFNELENKLMIIEQREVLGQDFKIYGDKDNPLFLAKDVSNWIEHSDTSKMLKSIDEEEKVKNIIPTLGGNQEMWFLTEDGLYEVLMQSRKPIAKVFKKEVKKILKEIRKTGSYKTPKIDSYMINDPVARAKAWIGEYEEKQILTKNIQVQKEIIQEYKPKVESFEEWISNNNLSTTTTVAKALGFRSAMQLNRELELRGIQYKQGDCWHLRAEYAGLNYTTYRGHTIKHSNGLVKSHDSMYWTNAGKVFLKNILNRNVMPMESEYRQIGLY